MENLEIGCNYKVAHSRKGQFKIHVTHLFGDFVGGTIIDGTAKYMKRHNDRHQGEEIEVRKDLCTFTQIP